MRRRLLLLALLCILSGCMLLVLCVAVIVVVVRVEHLQHGMHVLGTRLELHSARLVVTIIVPYAVRPRVIHLRLRIEPFVNSFASEPKLRREEQRVAKLENHPSHLLLYAAQRFSVWLLNDSTLSGHFSNDHRKLTAG